jgi:hypothetical protein
LDAAETTMVSSIAASAGGLGFVRAEVGGFGLAADVADRLVGVAGE